MKRVRGACKGCKCSVLTEDGDYECAVKDGHLRKPPQVCDNRIDVATLYDTEEDIQRLSGDRMIPKDGKVMK